MTATVKYCIWDVGQVVRRFSLKPLDEMAKIAGVLDLRLANEYLSVRIKKGAEQ